MSKQMKKRASQPDIQTKRIPLKISVVSIGSSGDLTHSIETTSRRITKNTQMTQQKPKNNNESVTTNLRKSSDEWKSLDEPLISFNDHKMKRENERAVEEGEGNGERDAEEQPQQITRLRLDSDLEIAGDPIVEAMMAQPVSYTQDLDEYVASWNNLDPLRDPFQADRMSRISDWVESTEGGVIDSEAENEEEEGESRVGETNPVDGKEEGALFSLEDRKRSLPIGLVLGEEGGEEHQPLPSIQPSTSISQSTLSFRQELYTSPARPSSSHGRKANNEAEDPGRKKRIEESLISNSPISNRDKLEEIPFDIGMQVTAAESSAEEATSPYNIKHLSYPGGAIGLRSSTYISSLLDPGLDLESQDEEQRAEKEQFSTNVIGIARHIVEGSHPTEEEEETPIFGGNERDEGEEAEESPSTFTETDSEIHKTPIITGYYGTMPIISSLTTDIYEEERRGIGEETIREERLGEGAEEQKEKGQDEAMNLTELMKLVNKREQSLESEWEEVVTEGAAALDARHSTRHTIDLRFRDPFDESDVDWLTELALLSVKKGGEVEGIHQSSLQSIPTQSNQSNIPLAILIRRIASSDSGDTQKVVEVLSETEADTQEREEQVEKLSTNSANEDEEEVEIMVTECSSKSRRSTISEDFLSKRSELPRVESEESFQIKEKKTEKRSDESFSSSTASELSSHDEHFDQSKYPKIGEIRGGETHSLPRSRDINEQLEQINSELYSRKETEMSDQTYILENGGRFEKEFRGSGQQIYSRNPTDLSGILSPDTVPTSSHSGTYIIDRDVKPEDFVLKDDPLFKKREKKNGEGADEIAKSIEVGLNIEKIPGNEEKLLEYEEIEEEPIILNEERIGDSHPLEEWRKFSLDTEEFVHRIASTISTHPHEIAGEKGIEIDEGKNRQDRLSDQETRELQTEIGVIAERTEELNQQNTPSRSSSGLEPENPKISPKKANIASDTESLSRTSTPNIPKQKEVEIGQTETQILDEQNSISEGFDENLVSENVQSNRSETERRKISSDLVDEILQGLTKTMLIPEKKKIVAIDGETSEEIVSTEGKPKEKPDDLAGDLEVTQSSPEETKSIEEEKPKKSNQPSIEQLHDQLVHIFVSAESPVDDPSLSVEISELEIETLGETIPRKSSALLQRQYSSGSRKNSKEVGIGGERMRQIRAEQHWGRSDTLQSDASQMSFVSSDLDRSSLVKLNYNSNVDQAAWKEGHVDVDIAEVDHFWDYRYSKDGQQPDEKLPKALELSPAGEEPPSVEVVRKKSEAHDQLLASTVQRYYGRRTPLPSITPDSALKMESSQVLAMSSPESEGTSIVIPTILKENAHITIQQTENADESPSSISIGSLSESETEEEQEERLNESQNFFRLAKASSESDSDQMDLIDDQEMEAQVEKEDQTKRDRRKGTPHPISRHQRRGERGRGGKGGGRGSDPSPVSPFAVPSPYSPLSSPHQPTHIKMILKRSASTESSQHNRKHSSTKHSYQMTGPFLPGLTFDSASPRLTDSQESLLEDEERLNALLEASGSPNGRKSVTFSEVVDNGTKPLLRSGSAIRLRGYKGILKKEDKQRESMRRILEYASERLYKDLCMLIEERDRAISALEMTPVDMAGMSPHSIEAHTNYRDQLLQNKGTLDARIDSMWRKLKNAPIDFIKLQCAWIFTVNESVQLTMKIRRKVLPRRNSAYFTIEKKKKSDIELASEYAQKLAQMRAELIRRDSEHAEEEGYRTLLQRISQTLGNHDAIKQMAWARDVKFDKKS